MVSGMWECEYSREPVDYRLLWLRFLKKIWIVPIAVLIGSILVGAVYYYARTTARGGRTYQAESIFYIDFAEDGQGTEYAYYNYFTWGEVIHTDYFMDNVYEKMNHELTMEELTEYITATVDSDVRYLYVRCNTHSPELSVRLAGIMEEIVPQFADLREEIKSIEVAKAGDFAKDSSKIRMGNAFFLGAFAGFVISVIAILLVLIIDTAVYLPNTLEKRCHILCLGTDCMLEFQENCKYVLSASEKIACVSVADENGADALTKVLGNKKEIIACKNPVHHPEELERIRSCDKVVVCVKAGCKNAEETARLLEQFARQEIEVTATMLVDVNEKLVLKYYRS